MKSFKALSLLLTYPGLTLQETIGAVRQTLHAEALFSRHDLDSMEPLLTRLEHSDIYDLQEDYVLLFDRSRTLSLNLFEHIHGESRDRGGAMVDLLETYRAGGFDLTGTELPDYLPVLLEFLSTQSVDDAREILADAGHILVALAQRLERRQTSYAAVLRTLVSFARADHTTQEAQALLAEKDDDPQDLEALDSVWEEAQVTFGPDPSAGCPTTATPNEVPIQIHRTVKRTAQQTGG